MKVGLAVYNAVYMDVDVDEAVYEGLDGMAVDEDMGVTMVVTMTIYVFMYVGFHFCSFSHCEPIIA